MREKLTLLVSEGKREAEDPLRNMWFERPRGGMRVHRIIRGRVRREWPSHSLFFKVLPKGDARDVSGGPRSMGSKGGSLCLKLSKEKRVRSNEGRISAESGPGKN